MHWRRTSHHCPSRCRARVQATNSTAPLPRMPPPHRSKKTQIPDAAGHLHLVVDSNKQLLRRDAIQGHWPPSLFFTSFLVSLQPGRLSLHENGSWQLVCAGCMKSLDSLPLLREIVFHIQVVALVVVVDLGQKGQINPWKFSHPFSPLQRESYFPCLRWEFTPPGRLPPPLSASPPPPSTEQWIWSKIPPL